MRYYKVNNDIYRQIKSDPTKAMLCTPNKSAERVIDITNELENINKHKAKEEINIQWDSFNDEWIFNGKKYRAKDTLVALGDLFQEKRNSKYLGEHFIWSFKGEYGKHDFHSTYKWPKTGEIRHSETTYWLGQFQGKLIWYTPHHYCPRAYAYNFEGVDIEPKGFGIGFIPMKHIKPVFCVTDKKWM